MERIATAYKVLLVPGSRKTQMWVLYSEVGRSLLVWKRSSVTTNVNCTLKLEKCKKSTIQVLKNVTNVWNNIFGKTGLWKTFSLLKICAVKPVISTIADEVENAHLT